MANMSYCRFENTLRDLRDCYNNMDDDDLSKSEFKHRKFMLQLCADIVNEYSYLIDEGWVEEEFDDIVELERE